MQGLIMFLRFDSIDDDIIANVLDIRDVTNSKVDKVVICMSLGAGPVDDILDLDQVCLTLLHHLGRVQLHQG